MLSGKSFADTCRWVVDNRYPDKPRFSPSEARTGDRVFLNGDNVLAFARSLSSIFNRKYTYVVHNSDQPFDAAKFYALEPTALHIYAINATVRHQKLTPIPIGFPDAAVPFVPHIVPRDIELYMNFTIGTNASKRSDCWNALKDDPRIVIKTGRTKEEYYEDLCRSKFVLCPEGTGIDTHRVWEALFCGATPIILRNPLSDLYAKYPVKLVESWNDITQFLS